METRETKTTTTNGWATLLILLVAFLGLLWWIINSIVEQSANGLILSIISLVVWLILMAGFFTLQPNVSAVLILFGKYKGTAHKSGFHWANPFYVKKKVSKRAHNLNGEKIKVNDHRGNPIEIAVVVVWRVVDTAKAVFDVEDYRSYVSIQSEAALRNLAMNYSYDTFDDEAEGEEPAKSLRDSTDEINLDLTKHLQERVARAGVHIEEARIAHLAYAQEIAAAMLQRQQAEAVVAARTRIVDGAVGMVEMALEKLEGHQTIRLDEERKAAMVSNLLVVLCGDKAAHPVVNTGTLYQ